MGRWGQGWKLLQLPGVRAPGLAVAPSRGKDALALRRQSAHLSWSANPPAHSLLGLLHHPQQRLNEVIPGELEGQEFEGEGEAGNTGQALDTEQPETQLSLTGRG